MFKTAGFIVWVLVPTIIIASIEFKAYGNPVMAVLYLGLCVISLFDKKTA